MKTLLTLITLSLAVSLTGLTTTQAQDLPALRCYDDYADRNTTVDRRYHIFFDGFKKGDRKFVLDGSGEIFEKTFLIWRAKGTVNVDEINVTFEGGRGFIRGAGLGRGSHNPYNMLIFPHVRFVMPELNIDETINCWE